MGRKRLSAQVTNTAAYLRFAPYFSILAALINALVLLVAVGAIAWEAIQTAIPEAVASDTVIWVASVGIVINGFTAWPFMSGQKQDMNIRGAYLHMMADAAVFLASFWQLLP